MTFAAHAGPPLVALLVGIALIGGLVGSVIGGGNGRDGWGFLLGAVLGPVGWLIAARLTPTVRAESRHRADERRAIPAVAEELRTLVELRDSGAITVDEFDAQRWVLLDSSGAAQTGSRCASSIAPLGQIGPRPDGVKEGAER